MNTHSTSISCTTFATPLGAMLASAEGDALTGLWFIGQRWFPRSVDAWTKDDDAPVFDLLRTQLGEYFAGERRAFDLPLAPGGDRASPFQRNVWDAIAAVPFGSTITYTELARAVGQPRAMRAAGAATGRNPLTLVIPCHRIVGRDGSLTGYAGGLERKRALLALEQGVREPGFRESGPLRAVARAQSGLASA
jgi:methylated-DNA-[protein]-cysteine S-methyltransferase